MITFATVSIYNDFCKYTMQDFFGKSPQNMCYQNTKKIVDLCSIFSKFSTLGKPSVIL